MTQTDSDSTVSCFCRCVMVNERERLGTVSPSRSEVVKYCSSVWSPENAGSSPGAVGSDSPPVPPGSCAGSPEEADGVSDRSGCAGESGCGASDRAGAEEVGASAAGGVPVCVASVSGAADAVSPACEASGIGSVPPPGSSICAAFAGCSSGFSGSAVPRERRNPAAAAPTASTSRVGRMRRRAARSRFINVSSFA